SCFGSTVPQRVHRSQAARLQIQRSGVESRKTTPGTNAAHDGASQPNAASWEKLRVSMNKRLLKRHKRHVARAKERVKLSEPDLRTPEQIKAAREASRSAEGRSGSKLNKSALS